MDNLFFFLLITFSVQIQSIWGIQHLKLLKSNNAYCTVCILHQMGFCFYHMSFHHLLFKFFLPFFNMQCGKLLGIFISFHFQGIMHGFKFKGIFRLLVSMSEYILIRIQIKTWILWIQICFNLKWYRALKCVGLGLIKLRSLVFKMLKYKLSHHLQNWQPERVTLLLKHTIFI